MRWQIETGFRVVDEHHCSWRSDKDGTRFIDELGRMWLIQDVWQMFQFEDPRGGSLTLQTFRDEMIDNATCQVNA